MRLFLLTTLTLFSACARKAEVIAHPTNPLAKRIHDSAVNIALNGKDYRKAISLLDSSIKIDPHYYDAFSKKLFFQFSLGQYDSALITAKQITVIRPDLPNTYVTCGILAERLHDTIAAKKYFARADNLYSAILDTLNRRSDNYKILTMYKGITLILSGNHPKGDKILVDLYRQEKDEAIKSSIAPYLFRSKQEIIDNLFKTHLQR